MTYRIGDQTVTLTAEARADGSLRVVLPDGGERVVSARRLPGDVIEIRDGDRVFRVPLARGGRNEVTLAWEGAAYAFAPEAPGRTGGGGSAGARSGVLTAPMVGVVADVLAAEGDAVAAHQPVIVVEAMKVLARIEAPFAGIIQSVRVRKGERVEHGQVLAEVAPKEE